MSLPYPTSITPIALGRTRGLAEKVSTSRRRRREGPTKSIVSNSRVVLNCDSSVRFPEVSRSLFVYSRNVRGRPKRENMAVSMNRVITEIFSPVQVSTTSPCA
jgi:hypothetical protein